MKIVVSVTNDIITDRRVAKTCSTLHNLGFEVVLIGRKLKKSLPIDSRPYKTIRMKLIFNRGAVFYAEYNIRLFLYLLFTKFDILLSNDLDTLLANYLSSTLKRKSIVYDSHEYFTELPELKYNRIAKKTWEIIEKWIFPKLKHTITVNNSIADLYLEKYGKRPYVVRNVPSVNKDLIFAQSRSIVLNTDKPIVIMQGAINIDRGAEELIQSMQFVDNAVLYIIGNGDVVEKLKTMIVELGLSNIVNLIPAMPYPELIEYTKQASIGVSLEKNTNLNYAYCLPNKLFDYIQNQVPVLVSNMVEMERIVTTYKVGETISSHDPKQIAMKINAMLADKEKLQLYKQNCRIAADQLCWENEEIILKNIYTELMNP